MSPRDYEVRIRPLSQGDGGGFFAEVPELPGGMSDGETPQEAPGNAYDAIARWMEAAKEMGRKVPEPKRAAAGGRCARRRGTGADVDGAAGALVR